MAQYKPRAADEKFGGVVERLMAPVLKTGRAQVLVGSNPTPSASSGPSPRFEPLTKCHLKANELRRKMDSPIRRN